MHFTLRQRQRLVVFAGLWVLLTGLCTAAGPFGTLDALGVVGRAAYWGMITGLSIVGSVLISRLPLNTAPQQGAAWLVYVTVLFAVVLGANKLLFGDQQGGPSMIRLFAMIALSVAVIYGLIYLARKVMAADMPMPDIDPQTKFLRRLPLQTRGPLIRIEAQDHYLNVVTTKGSALILLRLAEAVKELEGAQGLQTHRSHWVKLDAVTAHSRIQGRDVLTLSDGAKVPVARTRRDAVRAAGLLP